jgi:hypothetical protein
MAKWLPIPGFPGYEVSDDGQVRSLPRLSLVTPSHQKPHELPVPGKILAQTMGTRRYLQVGLQRNGKRVIRPVHKLVCEAFHGPKPSPQELYTVAHGNGINTDNRADNLSWKTWAEQAADRDKHGKTAIGLHNTKAKLSFEEVGEIRSLYLPKHPKFGASALSKKFGIPYQTIMNIVALRTRKNA